MKRMGLGIIYSDYNRLLIDTRKYSYEHAKQAVRYAIGFCFYIVSFSIPSSPKTSSA